MRRTLFYAERERPPAEAAWGFERRSFEASRPQKRAGAAGPEERRRRGNPWPNPSRIAVLRGPASAFFAEKTPPALRTARALRWRALQGAVLTSLSAVFKKPRSGGVFYRPRSCGRRCSWKGLEYSGGGSVSRRYTLSCDHIQEYGVLAALQPSTSFPVSFLR